MKVNPVTPAEKRDIPKFLDKARAMYKKIRELNEAAVTKAKKLHEQGKTTELAAFLKNPKLQTP